MDRAKAKAQQRILGELDRIIRRRPRGTISAVCHAAGKKANWWHGRVEAGTIALGELLFVLDHLGLEPAAFFRSVLGEEEDLALDRPVGEAPTIVLRARERLAEGREGPGLGSAYLETLDGERYENAEEAAAQALWAVERIELSLLPRLLGVAGSTYRMQYLLGQAYHTLHAGLTLARKGRDALAEANLVQRLAYVVADDGLHGRALRLAEQAAWLYLRHGDRPGMGTALVDQGMYLYYLDRPTEAIRMQEIALEMLDPTNVRNRCTALHGLALYYRRLGDLSAAQAEAARAEGLAQDLPPWLRVRLTWLQAEIYEEQGHLDQAEVALQEVAETFRSLDLGETALATCDLVRIQLLQDRPAAAFETAATLLPLLEPLRHERIVSAAIAELLRGGREGLTVLLVEQVKGRIEALREDPARWQSMRNAGNR